MHKSTNESVGYLYGRFCKRFNGIKKLIFKKPVKWISESALSYSQLLLLPK